MIVNVCKKKNQIVSRIIPSQFREGIIYFLGHKINRGNIMGFIDEIKKCFTLEELPKEPIFRAVLLGDSAGYFENVSHIKSYSPEQICLVFKKGELLINGNALYIKKYCGGDVVICGKIQSIQRV